jgi:hypothetical protein
VQNEALLSRETDVYDRLVRWLTAIAKASTPRVVTRTEELSDGRYIVCEEWPSRAAYLELRGHRLTLEAMLHTEKSDC